MHWTDSVFVPTCMLVLEACETEKLGLLLSKTAQTLLIRITINYKTRA